ncbi:rhodanese-like domain-containing protein [Pseudomonadota bacterium]
MKPIKALFALAVIMLTILMIGVVPVQADPPELQNDAAGLMRWQMSYDEIRGMSPKWGLQGIDAFKDTMDVGVPVIFLDVRTPKEWSEGVIDGALLINLNELPKAESIALLPQDRNAIIAVYCKSGHRSTMALSLMHQLGYVNAISMKGGWVAWSAAGYPTMAGPPLPAPAQ